MRFGSCTGAETSAGGYLSCTFFRGFPVLFRYLFKWLSIGAGGIFGTTLSMEAFTFIGAESTAWVWPDTVRLSMHGANTLLNNVTDRDSG